MGAKVTNFTTFIVVLSVKGNNGTTTNKVLFSQCSDYLLLCNPKRGDNHSSLFCWWICHVGRAGWGRLPSVLFARSKRGWLKSEGLDRVSWQGISNMVNSSQMMAQDSKGRKVETASFLRFGPGTRHSTTSVLFYGPKSQSTMPLFRAWATDPPLHGRCV